MSKLTSKLQSLSNQLHAEKRVGIHQVVDHFYYMQKIEEIKFLSTRREDLRSQLNNLSEIIDQEYRKIYCQWKKDYRFIISYKKNHPSGVSIL